MDNSIAQTEELLALQSIYDTKDLIIEQENPPCGRFIVNVQLSKPFHVVCKKISSDDLVHFEVDYLPPINLCFEFPPSYPSDSCPAFLLCCNWLSVKQLSLLCRKLESIWAESYGEVILFSWINFLQEETFNFLNIGDTLDVTEICRQNLISRSTKSTGSCQSSCIGSDFNKLSLAVEKLSDETSIHSSEVGCERKREDFVVDNEFKNNKAIDIKPSVTGGSSCIDRRAITDGLISLSSLKEYNAFMQKEAFKNTWILCQICYATKKGVDFQSFNSCTHNFCCDCLRSYFEIQINEGNVHSLNCPQEGCSSQADGTLVKNLVGTELFEKYDTLLLSRTLEGMTDIAYCPRQMCQTPLLVDPGSSIGTCPLCSFAFCIFCQKAYHGIAPCNFKAEEKRELCRKYMDSTADEKTELERRFGKRELRFLVENVQSEVWMECNSKKCPHCQSHIEKTDGCNKMTCYRCGKYFCWLCNALLKPSNPYTHFSDVSSNCYNQLFPENFDFAFPGEYLDL